MYVNSLDFRSRNRTNNNNVGIYNEPDAAETKMYKKWTRLGQAAVSILHVHTDHIVPTPIIITMYLFLVLSNT